MTKQVVAIPIGKTVAEVATLMKKHEIGSVVVVEEKAPGRAKGILTERDIVHKVVALGKDPSRIKVDEAMSKPLRVISPTASLEEASTAMRENRVKRLPVINERQELIGIISESDIMRVFPAVVDLLEERVAALSR